MINFGVGTDDAIAAVLEGKNVFITGSGGTGKSHTIRTIQALYSNSTLTVAPTGVAALNVDGVTTHKAFGLSFGVSTEADTQKISKKAEKLLKSKALERIIIDEVSMIRGDKLYEMDHKCRLARKKPDLPFGGLQIIMLGDFFQNGPVLTNEEEELYFQYHDSDLCCFTKTWEELAPFPILLEKQHRQNSVHFSSMLNCLRKGQRIPDIVNFINRACYDGGSGIDAVTLTTTNYLADQINMKHYKAIQGEEQIFRAEIKEDFTQQPVAEEMGMKVGLKVMIVVNDPDTSEGEPKYANGSLGHVVKILKHSVDVKLVDTDEVVNIGQHTWENAEYVPRKKRVNGKMVDELERIVIGSYKALPLRMGYALTIHKVQGLTLPVLNVDFGQGTFAPGMAYVAFSRATTAKGLRVLRKLRERDIIVDQRVVRFYEDLFPGR